MSDQTHNHVQNRASEGQTQNINASISNWNQAYDAGTNNQNQVYQVAQNMPMRQSTNGWDRLPIRPAHPAWNLPAWIGNHVNREGEEKKDEREYYSHFVAMWRE